MAQLTDEGVDNPEEFICLLKLNHVTVLFDDYKLAPRDCLNFLKTFHNHLPYHLSPCIFLNLLRVEVRVASAVANKQSHDSETAESIHTG